MNQPKLTPIGRKLYLMVKRYLAKVMNETCLNFSLFRFRLTFLTQLVRKIMQPLETTTSEVEKGFFVYFPLLRRTLSKLLRYTNMISRSIDFLLF